MDFTLVIYDSFNVAADNGEYLYRQLRELHPETKLTFLISKTCSDYNRLQKDGFNVLPIESSKIDSAMRDADFILYSKNLGFNHDVQRVQKQYRNKTIFLDHGVTAEIYNDSFYFQGTINDQAKYVCCTSEDEFNVLKKYSGGRITPILCGFPRHDTLLNKYREYEKNRPSWKQVFISFHWRKGDIDGNINSFLKSSYFFDINNLLNDEMLKKMVDQGTRICFRPHARFMKYSGKFKVPDYICRVDDQPFQDILVQSDILVTDFSSNGFEMAYMNKPTISYVPGLAYVKSRMPHYNINNIGKYKHITYCKSIGETIQTMSELVGSNGSDFKFAENTFKYVDTNNSERLFQWMVDNCEEVRKSQKVNPFIRFQFG